MLQLINMKSLKYSDLKGSRTAIHCSTQLEWDKVTEICGYEWVYESVWRNCGDVSCINLNHGATYANISWYKKNQFSIIPASDFIAANSEGEDGCGNKKESTNALWDTVQNNMEQSVLFNHHKEFLNSLGLLHQTEIANYYNIDKTDNERLVRNGAIEAIGSIIKLYKETYSTLPPSPESK